MSQGKNPRFGNTNIFKGGASKRFDREGGAAFVTPVGKAICLWLHRVALSLSPEAVHPVGFFGRLVRRD